MPVSEGAGASEIDSASSKDSLRMLLPGPLGRLVFPVPATEAGAGAARRKKVLMIGIGYIIGSLLLPMTCL